MDRNQILGLLLIFLMVTTYYQFFAPPPPENEPKQEVETKKKPESATENTQLNPTKNPRQAPKSSGEYGVFSKALQGKKESYILKNDKVEITFNSEGGRPVQVRLSKFTTYDQKPLMLFDDNSNFMALNATLKGSKQQVDLYKLYYKPQKFQAGDSTLRLRAEISAGKYVEQVYTLPKEGYELRYQLRLVGLENALSSKAPVQLYWFDNLKRVESDLAQSRYYTTINYYDAEDGFDYLTWPSNEQEEVKLGKTHWFAFKQKFFTAALIAENKNLQKVLLTHSTNEADSNVVKTMQAYADLSLKDLSSDKGEFRFYFGPNRFQVLYDVEAEEFYRNVYLGMPVVKIFTRYLVVPLFLLLEGVMSNYGLIIILLVLIIKMGLFPLTYSSYKGMAKMRIINELIQPDLDAFKEKHGLKDKSFTTFTSEEQQKVQQEQMRLYQQLGSSPFASLSGCIPLLLQMPIILAMFTFFPNAIELRQQSFLWAHDLSTYDSILNLPFTIPFYGSHVSLFTLLMTLSTIGLTYMTSKNQAATQQAPGFMKYMGYIFPVVFMFILNSYPSGLSLYYLVQNLVTIGQQAAIKKYFIDEEKIRRSYEDYKENERYKDKKGKSSWQQKLEDKLRKAQEDAEERKKQQKAKRDLKERKKNNKHNQNGKDEQK